MATFYLLPARPVVADRLADLLAMILPGFDWTVSARRQLADLLLEAAGSEDQTFVLSRDELPLGEAPERALIDGFGAEPGDEVVEVRWSPTGEFRSFRWRVGMGLRHAA